ncbi:hypothetical protein BGZ94_006002, partial [Podila epigama]
MKRQLYLLSLLSMVMLAAYSVPVPDGDDDEDELCPQVAAVLYKDCSGNLQDCSLCLAEAEKACSKLHV